MTIHPILREEGIAYTEQWEPSHFLKQRGSTNAVNLESHLSFLESETYVAHLAAIGVNQVWTWFHKGYGMAFEDAQQQRLGTLAERCHRRGIRVIAYCTFGTLALHEMLAEEPGAADWVAKPDVFAHASYTGYHSFRARVDYTSREWIDYMVRVVDKAIDLGADGIHFDNAEMPIGFEACRCARCTRLFREHLDQRYGTATAATRRAGLARHGTNDFRHVEPPWFTLSQHPVNQRQLLVPLQQDWAEFRCDSFTSALKRLTDHIRGRGRLVEANLGKNENINNPYYRGLDYERTYPLVDLAFHENFDRPGFNRHGSPVCAIRSFKVADAFARPLMLYATSPLELMESFTFNPGACGKAWAGMTAERVRQFAFIRRWRHYNTRSASLAQVAVLRHRTSMTFDSYDPAQNASAVEQLLQEDHVPFDILAASQLDRLPRYRLLIIPCMRWMTDAEGRAISRWVRGGGRLLLVGEVGIRNAWNQLRSAVKTIRTVEDFKRVEEVAPLFTPLVRRRFDADFLVSAGRGAVGFIAKLDHPAVAGTDLADWRVERDHLNIPRNAESLRAALRNLLGDAVGIRVGAPNAVAIEWRRRADTGEGVLQLLNLGWERKLAADARIAFRWSGRVRHVSVLRWERDGVERLPVRRDGEWYVCDVTGIREHALLVVPTPPRPSPAAADRARRASRKETHA